MNQCDIPCPKCGSADILRRFHARGEHIENQEYNKPPCNWTAGQCYHYKADRDLIKHYCRCCTHVWVSKPLAAPKKKRADQPSGSQP